MEVSLIDRHRVGPLQGQHVLGTQELEEALDRRFEVDDVDPDVGGGRRLVDVDQQLDVAEAQISRPVPDKECPIFLMVLGLRPE